MSERSSFVTEFIYCNRCLEKLKTALVKQEKYLAGVQIPIAGMDGCFTRIIAGKIGSLGPMEEVMTLMDAFNKDNAPCHPIRICVLHDDGNSVVYVIGPDGRVDLLGSVSASELKQHNSQKRRIERVQGKMDALAMFFRARL